MTPDGPAEPPAPPKQVGRYQLLSVIASGGMATVHFGRVIGAAGFERLVAIKRLHRHSRLQPEDRSSFVREARLAASVRHANVIPTLDVVEDEGELLVVLEYVPGITLSQLLKHSTGVPPGVAAAIAGDLLEGLHAAHVATNAEGRPTEIIHRDVSPHNVLLGEDGVARVFDFGIAKVLGEVTTTSHGTVKGKLAYMAPELLAGGRATRRSDVYAAGVVLWELLTGRRLYKGDEGFIVSQILMNAPPRVRAIVADVPAALDDVVAKMLAKEDDRFATAREAASALRAAVGAPADAAEVAGWMTAHASQPLLEARALRADAERAVSLRPPAMAPALGPHVGTTGGGTPQTSTVVLAFDAKQPPKRRAPWLVLVGLGASLVVVVFLARAVGARSATAVPPGAASAPVQVLEVAPPSAPASGDPAAPAPAPSDSAGGDPPKAAATTPLRRPPAPARSCDPPWTVDSLGRRIYKRGCL